MRKIFLSLRYSWSKVCFTRVGFVKILLLCIVVGPLGFLLFKETNLDASLQMESWKQSAKLLWFVDLTVAGNVTSSQITTIGIGCAVTMRGAQAKRYTPKDHSPQRINESMYLNSFLPSFCATSSDNFRFHFVVSYDYNDLLLRHQANVDEFERIFHATVRKQCPSNLDYSLRMLKCPYSKQPARSQNDAMMLLYLNDVDYMYRVNDDTTMTTTNWEDFFINALRTFEPPNVGVTGPETKAKHHWKFLTYEFVHRTHVDIFGFYYPPFLTDWYGDRWIDNVYRPGHSRRVIDVIHKHNFDSLGQRYVEHALSEDFINYAVGAYKATVNRYLSHVRGEPTDLGLDTKTIRSNYVICIGLWGEELRHTHGAIRNARLAPILFPGWTLRVYVPPLHLETAVPLNILQQLVSLGAEVAYVRFPDLDKKYWRFSIVNEPDVDAFIIRDADMRLSERESRAVNEWLQSDKAVHCINDTPDALPNQSECSHGLLGVRPKLFLRRTGIDIASIVQRTYMGGKSSSVSDASPWKQLEEQMLCHVSQQQQRAETSTKVLSPPTICGEHIGQKYTWSGQPLQWFPLTGNCKDLNISSLTRPRSVWDI